MLAVQNIPMFLFDYSDYGFDIAKPGALYDFPIISKVIPLSNGDYPHSLQMLPIYYESHLGLVDIIDDFSTYGDSGAIYIPSFGMGSVNELLNDYVPILSLNYWNHEAESNKWYFLDYGDFPYVRQVFDIDFFDLFCLGRKYFDRKVITDDFLSPTINFSLKYFRNYKRLVYA